MGYGDITPTNPYEVAVCMGLLLCSAFMWAWFVGRSCNIVAQMSIHTTRFKTTVDSLNAMIEDSAIPSDLAERLRGYMHNGGHVSMLGRHTQMLQSLSPDLQREVAAHAMRRWGKSVPLVHRGKPAFVASIFISMRLRLFAPQEVRPCFASAKAIFSQTIVCVNI